MSDFNAKFIQGNQINNFSGEGGAVIKLTYNKIIHIIKEQQENSFKLLNKPFFKTYKHLLLSMDFEKKNYR